MMLVIRNSYLDHPGYIPTFRQLTEASRRWFPKQQRRLCTHETGVDKFWTYGSTRTREDTQRHRQWTTVADGGTHNNQSQRTMSEERGTDRWKWTMWGGVSVYPFRVENAGSQHGQTKPKRLAGRDEIRTRTMMLQTPTCAETGSKELESSGRYGPQIVSMVPGSESLPPVQVFTLCKVGILIA